jgi:hypothetical protein
MKDTFNIIGVPTIELYDANGRLKQSLTERNLIVKTGKNYFLRKAFDQFGSGSEPALEVVAVGSGTTTPTIDDTSLESQFGSSTVDSYSFLSNNEIVLLTGFIQGVGTGTINELGLLATDGTLISRIVVSQSFEKTATDFLNVNWSFQIG